MRRWARTSTPPSLAAPACTAATASAISSPATTTMRHGWPATCLGYLPSHRGDPLPRAERRPAGEADLDAIVPDEPRRVYDVRDVIHGLVDGGELLEIASGWARNLVTGMARIDGRPVGVIANQPRYLGGVLDAASSEKGARFVSKCDAFGVPLLVLVDTPGYMPGTRQEGAGRHSPRRLSRPRLRAGDSPENHRDPA